MEKYLKEIISQKGLSEAYKECIHMIESLIGIIEEAEIESIYKP